MHEMLHVLVESECSDRTALWLREGLVEALADDHPQRTGAEPLSASTIESGLLHPNSQIESERAHAAAEERVRSLITRYGLSTVRVWLSSGVPAGVR